MKQERVKKFCGKIGIIISVLFGAGTPFIAVPINGAVLKQAETRCLKKFKGAERKGKKHNT